MSTTENFAWTASGKPSQQTSGSAKAALMQVLMCNSNLMCFPLKTCNRKYRHSHGMTNMAALDLL